jgi:cytochrome c
MKPFAARIPITLSPVALAVSIVAFGLAHALPAHADAAAGKNAFAACAACHSVNGSDGIGPHLNGVIGRKAGSIAGFNYSSAVKRANIVWDANSLGSYIANPQQVIPGNHMPFSGVPDATTRADIVAYLTTLH